ncbi:MAG: hypothetical protein IJZ68_07485 [Bacteroidaceae bacterium]|nr:hypothetical protein [Bacteroidaceae bacterium]
MKKIIALLCAVLMLCMCAACSNKPDYNDDITPEDNSTEPTYEVQDPQKDNAIPTDDLSRYATATGVLTNYRLAAGYTSTTENIVTIIMHDGKNQQTRKIFYNTVNPDGTSMMNKQEEFRYVWSENAKYTVKDDEEVKAEYAFAQPALETTFAVSVDELTCKGFYDAIVQHMATATYNIIKDYYELDTIQLDNGEETILFDDIYITVSNGRIESIHCTNGTQTITIELTGINDVNFGGEE